jgi:hypothetical protein
VLQRLVGDAAPDWDNRLDETAPRAHIAAPYHATPLFRTPRHEGTGLLALLAWTGSDPAEAESWKITSSVVGSLHLTHPELGDWKIEHWSLPALT